MILGEVNMSFKSNLISIKSNIDNLGRDKETIIEECISFKLNRSLVNYVKGVDRRLKYLFRKDEEKVIKELNKRYHDEYRTIENMNFQYIIQFLQMILELDFKLVERKNQKKKKIVQIILN